MRFHNDLLGDVDTVGVVTLERMTRVRFRWFRWFRPSRSSRDDRVVLRWTVPPRGSLDYQPPLGMDGIVFGGDLGPLILRSDHEIRLGL